jgi:hypothetical protein
MKKLLYITFCALFAFAVSCDRTENLDTYNPHTSNTNVANAPPQAPGAVNGNTNASPTAETPDKGPTP